MLAMETQSYLHIYRDDLRGELVGIWPSKEFIFVIVTYVVWGMRALLTSEECQIHKMFDCNKTWLILFSREYMYIIL